MELKKVLCWRRNKLINVEVASKPITLQLIFEGLNPRFDNEFSIDDVLKFFNFYNTPIKKTTLNTRFRYLRKGGWIKISSKSWLGFRYRLTKKSFDYIARFRTFTNPKGYLMRRVL